MRYFKHGDSPIVTRFKVVFGILIVLLTFALLVIMAYRVGQDNRPPALTPSTTQSIDLGGYTVDVHQVEINGQQYLVWMSIDRMCVTPLK